MSTKFEKIVLEKLEKLEVTQQDTLEKLVNFEKFTILKFQDLQGEINDVKIDVKELKEDVGELKVRVGDLETDVKELKEDVGNLKEDVGELKVRVENLETDVKELKEDVGNLKEDVRELKEGAKATKADLQITKEAVILIEDKITREIPTLFDGYSMHQEKQERQGKEISIINRKIRNHDARISSLEQNVV